MLNRPESQSAAKGAVGSQDSAAAGTEAPPEGQWAVHAYRYDGELEEAGWVLIDEGSSGSVESQVSVHRLPKGDGSGGAEGGQDKGAAGEVCVEIVIELAGGRSLRVPHHEELQYSALQPDFASMCAAASCAVELREGWIPDSSGISRAFGPGQVSEGGLGCVERNVPGAAGGFAGRCHVLERAEGGGGTPHTSRAVVAHCTRCACLARGCWVLSPRVQVYSRRRGPWDSLPIGEGACRVQNGRRCRRCRHCAAELNAVVSESCLQSK